MAHIHFEKGQRGQDIPLLDQPYEMVGDFLQLEGDRLDTWPFTVLLPEIETIRMHKRKGFAYAGDAYSVDVSQDKVNLLLVAIDPPDECKVPLEEFYSILVAWRDHLEGKDAKQARMRKQGPEQPRLATGQFHRFGNEKLTWAGECPWTRGFCYGTESGKIIISPKTLNLDSLGLTGGINAVAFSRELIGVTSSNEILVVRASPLEEQFSVIGKADVGANGIVSTPTGHFAAPRGKQGIILMRRDSGEVTLREVGVVKKVAIDYHSLIYTARKAADVFACAGRRSGILAVVCDWKSWHTVVIGHPLIGRDIVAICSIRSHGFPFAVAAIGSDKTIFLTRHVVNQRPIGITVPLTAGSVVRSIQCADGHLFVLTDQSLHVLHGLAARFLSGDRLDEPTPIVEMPVAATFASLAYDRFLLLGMRDAVFSVDSASLLPMQIQMANKTTKSRDREKSLFRDLKLFNATPRFESIPTEEKYEYAYDLQ